MKVSAQIDIICAAPLVAATLVKALRPDNVDLPKGLSLDALRLGSHVRIAISEEEFKSFLPTINEIFSHTLVSLMVITETR